MEVIKKTPLSEVRKMREQLVEKEQKITELSETKELLEEQILQLMDVSATLYEEKEMLQQMNMTSLEAIAELYELVSQLGGNS